MTEPARCQLYLAAPAVLPAGFGATLAAVLDAVEVACLRLPPAADIGELVRLAQQRGTAVVIAGDVEVAAQVGADGVHLPDLRNYAAARSRLDADAILGIACDDSRHAAMEAGEAGADYVSLAADLELVRWWAEMMVVPVVAELAENLDQAADFAAAGAEFIALGEALWRDPAGAATAAKRVGAILQPNL
jgi:thiamine-phosphate pyrophosphorylase